MTTKDDQKRNACALMTYERDKTKDEIKIANFCDGAFSVRNVLFENKEDALKLIT